MKKIIGVSIVSFFVLCLTAQNDVDLKLALRDGNVVSGTSKMASISLNTAYGKLEIPIKNFTALDLGITSDKTTNDKVVNLVKQLSYSNEQMCKTAFYELVKRGTTYPAYGNVVYKIGETSTQTLKAGAKFNETTTTTGMFFISIYETVYNANNSGSYTVKISLK